MSMQTISIGDGQRARQHPLEKVGKSNLNWLPQRVGQATFLVHLVVQVVQFRRGRQQRLQLTGPICLSTSNAFGNERQGPAVCALGRRPEWNVTVRSRTGFGTLTFLFFFWFCRFYLKSGTARRKCGRRFECWLTSAASQRNFYSDFLWFAPNFFFLNEEKKREKKRGQVEFNYYGLLKVWIKRVHTSRRWNCAHERTRHWRDCLTLSSFTSNLSNKSNCVDAAKGEMTWHFRFHLFPRPPFNHKNPIKNDIFLNVWNVFKFLLSSRKLTWTDSL